MSVQDIRAVQIAEQQPNWPDPELVDEVRRELRRRPALVTEQEVCDLTESLAAAQQGNAFVIQAGDCAELFVESSPHLIHRKLAQVDALADAVRCDTGVPVVRVGRIAGQFGKPRSCPTERRRSGELLTSYRGDAVNHVAADPRGRRPDPRRLLTAYDIARATLDVIRGTWTHRAPADRVYASHELLLLDYELPLLREGERGQYAASAHTGWVGNRTNSPGGVHVTLAASVSNPVAVKVGPSTSPDQAVALSHVLNPDDRPGRLSFIVRLGATDVDTLLPPLVSAVSQRGAPVIWLCDPLHGNTIRTSSGRKTRSLHAIGHEVAAFTRVTLANWQWPGGLHLEVTPEDVTECVALPADGATVVELPRYQSACDPRLNPDQAAEVIAVFTAALQQSSG